MSKHSLAPPMSPPSRRGRRRRFFVHQVTHAVSVQKSKQRRRSPADAVRHNDGPKLQQLAHRASEATDPFATTTGQLRTRCEISGQGGMIIRPSEALSWRCGVAGGGSIARRGRSLTDRTVIFSPKWRTSTSKSHTFPTCEAPPGELIT